MAVARHIPFRPIRAIMRLTINLDCQPPFQTGEIKHQFADWMLPPEPITTRPFAQLAPD